MIVKVIEEIENTFKDLLLSEINFCINDKIIKKGKLLNLSIKDFYIVFLLEVQKGGKKTYEIPYPFHILKNNKSILFDYKVDTFVHNDPVKYVKVKNFKPKKNSKFYDVEMIIRKA